MLTERALLSSYIPEPQSQASARFEACLDDRTIIEETDAHVGRHDVLDIHGKHSLLCLRRRCLRYSPVLEVVALLYLRANAGTGILDDREYQANLIVSIHRYGLRDQAPGRYNPALSDHMVHDYVPFWRAT